MPNWLQALFFLLIVRPFLALVLGVNLRHAERLPQTGPAILAANHNSHLDTLLLMSLFPLNQLHQLRPVAAADYFLSNPLVAWFSRNIIRILPLRRKVERGDDLFAPLLEELDKGRILILFPEGSRGEPEKMSQFKNGIAHLTSLRPDVPVIPVYLHGLGKVLPKGDWLPVPFFVDGFVGEEIRGIENRTEFMAALKSAFDHLSAEGKFDEWE
jgi:1-acyl-sn-glycerol-3-phosphate acyltransferase